MIGTALGADLKFRQLLDHEAEPSRSISAALLRNRAKVYHGVGPRQAPLASGWLSTKPYRETPMTAASYTTRGDVTTDDCILRQQGRPYG